MNLLSNSKSIEHIERCRRFRPKQLAGGEGTFDGCDRFFWLRVRRHDTPSGGHEIYSVFDEDGYGRKGFRLCNLVLQGGGALGLAHAGFVTGLENAGLRFAGIAGTSAGSIIAMGLAAIRGDCLTRETHMKLTDLTENVPMDRFIDGPRPVRKLIKSCLRGEAPYWPRNWMACIAAISRLRDERGLNRGQVFERWLEQVLAELGFTSIDAMYDALGAVWEDLSQLNNRADPKVRPFSGRAHREHILKTHDLEHPDQPGAALLQLIATAMPVGLKVNLPQDLRLISLEYEHVSPARLVRTSMSIPGFFEPVTMRTDPNTWPAHVSGPLSELLSEHQVARFETLGQLTFLDGGMLSNLPSDSFRDLMPDVPTIVVPIMGGGKTRNITRRRMIRDLAHDTMACVTAIRLQRDREVWLQNTHLRNEFDNYEKRYAWNHRRLYPVEIAPIDTGDANWLNFSMSPKEKADLFHAGLESAARFLESLAKKAPAMNGGEI